MRDSARLLHKVWENDRSGLGTGSGLRLKLGSELGLGLGLGVALRLGLRVYLRCQPATTRHAREAYWRESPLAVGGCDRKVVVASNA